MGKAGKATKKFQKNHLGDAIKKRRDGKQMKKWIAARKAPKGKSKSADEEEDKAEKKSFKEMDVDEFLNSGFEIQDSDEEEVDSASEGEDDLAADEDDEEDDEDDGAEDAEEEEEDSDEDEEAEDADDENLKSVKAKNKQLEDTVSSHKKDLQALEAQDPEFFKYLQENDADLLQYDDSDEEDMDADGEAPGSDDDTGPGAEGEAGPKAKEGAVLTTALVNKWCAAAKEKGALGAVKNLLRAYRSACHYSDDTEQEDEALRIGSSGVFNKVMMFVLKEMDSLLRRLLGMGPDDQGVNVPLTKRPRWKKIEPLVKSYIGNTLHILGQMTDPTMIAYTLRRLGVSVDFLNAFERLLRKVLRQALGMFGGGGSYDNAKLRVAAILFIRRLTIKVPSSLEQCLKGVYRTYVANTKFASASSVGAISFMADCVVEMCGLDMPATYQYAFVEIRQLAVSLRAALTTKTKDSFRAVYNWQAVWSMEVWTRVVVAYSDRAELQPLIYPLTQIISGAARLLSAVRYFPLRLQLVRMLTRISSACNLYTPVSALLTDVLKFKELSQKPMGSSANLDLNIVLKVPKSMLRTTSFQESVVQEALDSLGQHLLTWGYSPAFPELLHVPSVQLRAFIKRTPVDRFRKWAKNLLDSALRHADWVKAKREQVDFAPKDAADVAGFMQREREAGEGPLAAHCKHQKARAEQRKAALHATSVKTDDGDGGDGDGELRAPELGSRGGDDDDDDDGDDEFEGMDGYGGDGDDEDVGMGEEDAAPKAKGKKAGKSTGNGKAANGALDDLDMEDEVSAFNLDNSSDEEAAEGNKPAGKSRKKDKKPAKKGGMKSKKKDK